MTSEEAWAWLLENEALVHYLANKITKWYGIGNRDRDDIFQMMMISCHDLLVRWYRPNMGAKPSTVLFTYAWRDRYMKGVLNQDFPVWFTDSYWGDEEDSGMPLGTERVPSVTDDLDDAIDASVLIQKVFVRLDEREQKIIKERYWELKTLEAVAKEHGLSRQRIQQIEQKAMRKLRWGVSHYRAYAA